MRNFYFFIVLLFITGITLSAQTIKLTGTIIGTQGSWGDNPATTIEAAFDGDLATYCDPVGNGSWAGLDLGNDSLSVVILFRFAPRATHPQRTVGALIQGADNIDFNDAVTLDTIKTEPPIETYTELEIDNSTAYRYVRIMTPGSALNVAEIEFYKKDTIYVTGINVSGTGNVTSVLNGQTLQMVAEVLPSDADNDTVIWSVNDKSVASIDSKTGLLTSKAPGVVVVTATAIDGSGISGSDTITVKAVLSDNTYLSSLTVDVGDLSPAFDSATYDYTLDVPASTSTVNVTAITSSKAATVTGDGAVDVSSGDKTVSIAVKSEDGKQTKTYTVSITKELTGTEEKEMPEAQIYPNPVVNSLHVKVSPSDIIDIYNSVGQLIKHEVAGLDSMVINVSGFETGIYMLVITNETQQIRAQFIKLGE